MHEFSISRLLISVMLAIMLAGSAQAQTDFSGQTIKWTIPFREHGGSDAWARFNTPYLSKYLPGAPQIEVVNVPGGSSTKGTNQFAETATSDGLALLGTSASTQFPFLLGDSRVRYDYADWRVLLVYPTGGVVYVSPELGIESIDELLALAPGRLTYGSQGVTSIDILPLLGFELLGLQVRPIFGIRGGSAKQLAFERGDTTIDFQTSAAYLKNIVPLVESGKAIPLFSLGSLDANGNLVRDLEFPELPHIGEVYEQLNNRAMQGIGWESWFSLFSAGLGAQKLLVIPKDTPTEIVEAYQNALESMQNDPEYIARKPTVLGAYDQVTGVAAERLYKLATDVPDVAKKWIRSWLRERYDVNL